MRVRSDNWLVGVRRKLASDMGGKLVAREYGVIHYTGGVSLNGAQATLTAQDATFVSAHVALGRDGETRQFVPFDRIAYHAGVSSWNGHTGLNTRALGVELVNPGYYRAGLPAEWPIARAAHRNGGSSRDWYLYPDVQIDALIALIVALRDGIGLRKWVGHDHISPGRKLDPGPVFPWEKIASIPGILAPKR